MTQAELQKLCIPRYMFMPFPNEITSHGAKHSSCFTAIQNKW